MNGVPPGSGPHPDCPGYEVLRDEYLAARHGRAPENQGGTVGGSGGTQGGTQKPSEARG
jgi:hypothetical protein